MNVFNFSRDWIHGRQPSRVTKRKASKPHYDPELCWNALGNQTTSILPSRSTSPFELIESPLGDRDGREASGQATTLLASRSTSPFEAIESPPHPIIYNDEEEWQSNSDSVFPSDPVTGAEDIDSESLLLAVNIQIKDINHDLKTDVMDEDNRKAMRSQLKELKSLRREGDNAVNERAEFGQPNLGPSAITSDIPVGTEHMNTHHPVRQPPTHECIACSDETPERESFKTPCGHRFCKGCLQAHIQAAMRNENEFPPRCCEDLPEDTIAAAMGHGFIPIYQAKKHEVNTPINMRVYCCNPECAKYLDKRPPVMSISRRMCHDCGWFTCTRCDTLAQKKDEDYHKDCIAGESDESFLSAVHDAGYQRCYQCNRWVELNWGCFHMTCLCSAQFCYLCGKRWKTCACRQWDEWRLEARARDIVDRPPRPRNPVRRQRMIEQTMEHLRLNHECDHRHWKRIYRRLKCEDCGKVKGNMLQCRNCHLRACCQCKKGKRPLP